MPPHAREESEQPADDRKPKKCVVLSNTALHSLLARTALVDRRVLTSLPARADQGLLQHARGEHTLPLLIRLAAWCRKNGRGSTLGGGG